MHLLDKTPLGIIHSKPNRSDNKYIYVSNADHLKMVSGLDIQVLGWTYIYIGIYTAYTSHPNTDSKTPMRPMTQEYVSLRAIIKPVEV